MDFLWFLAAAFLAFFVPGDLLVKKLALPFFPRVVLALGLGVVLWAFQGFLFGFLGWRDLTYVYLLICGVIWLKSNFQNFPRPKLSFDPVTIAIIAMGVLFQLSAIWFLGSPHDGGLLFCCRGVPDDIYHLALTNELVSQFPPQEPGMTGVVVKNYHYLASLTMADLVRVFHLPLISTIYRYFSVFISVLLGLSILVTARFLDLDRKITRLWLFFLYFHGDILYWLLLLRGRGLNFDVTIFDDATKLLAGPPRSFSIFLLFTGLALFVIWVKKRNGPAGLLTALVLGALIGFKVYTGVFILTGLAAVAGYFIWKRDRKMLWPPILALATSLAIYLPVNGIAGGFSWNGFYRFSDFISQPVFGLQNFELMRQAGASYLVIFFAIAYFVFLYGTSLLALFQSRKTFALLPREVHLFFLPGIVITWALGTYFVQSIGGLNSVQFLISLYFVVALYSALAVSRLSIWAIIIVVLLTVPRPIYEVWGNIQMVANKQGFFVSVQELAGLNFLKNETPPNAVVAIPPDLARQEVSLHVAFLANRPLYVAGYIGVLQDHQVPGALDRLTHPDFSQIDYFYFPKKYSAPSLPPGQVVFENSEVKILKIPKT